MATICSTWCYSRKNWIAAWINFVNETIATQMIMAISFVKVDLGSLVSQFGGFTFLSFGFSLRCFCFFIAHLLLFPMDPLWKSLRIYQRTSLRIQIRHGFSFASTVFCLEWLYLFATLPPLSVAGLFIIGMIWERDYSIFIWISTKTIVVMYRSVKLLQDIPILS